MSDVCPVCGKGESETFVAGAEDDGSPCIGSRAVSHLESVRKLEAINNTNRDGWRDTVLDNERLRTQLHSVAIALAMERCGDADYEAWADAYLKKHEVRDE